MGEGEGEGGGESEIERMSHIVCTFTRGRNERVPISLFWPDYTPNS